MVFFNGIIMGFVHICSSTENGMYPLIMGLSWDSHGIIMGLSWDYNGIIMGYHEVS